jgi:uncharacterized protein YjbK
MLGVRTITDMYSWQMKSGMQFGIMEYTETVAAAWTKRMLRPSETLEKDGRDLIRKSWIDEGEGGYIFCTVPLP